MGFVKTAEEIDRLKDVLSHPRFVNAEMLSVEFLTTPQFVRHVLPPGLEPAAEPLMSAMVGRWQSNCVGDYAGGALYVAARHGSIEATYVLAMYMTTDVSIMFGREVLGEPKKQCSTGLNRGGTRMSGWIERHGVRLITLAADLTTDLGQSEGKGANFNIKATPACDGRGLEDDALITLAEFDLRLRASREGTGTVTVNGTAHDPLDEIPIAEVRRATYIEGDLYATARPLTRIPKDQFLPYAFGRLDDLTALNTEPVPLGVA